MSRRHHRRQQTMTSRHRHRRLHRCKISTPTRDAIGWRSSGVCGTARRRGAGRGWVTDGSPTQPSRSIARCIGIIRPFGDSSA
jgi:hypothetical protein